MPKRKITVSVRNSWLNSLEEMLYSDLTIEESVKAKKRCKKLWHELVKEYYKQGKSKS